MAASLTITGFHDAVDYKIVKCTSIEDATVVVNATGSSGTLYAAFLDSAGTSAAVSLHILDGKDTALTEIAIKGAGTSVRSVQIPTGFAFDMLNFWVSASSAEDNTTDFAGTVAVTLICT
tara:strand:+ start:106 stop:465 length:360 start_codon:yes stop_codon:yes gene_type:complete